MRFQTFNISMYVFLHILPQVVAEDFDEEVGAGPRKALSKSRSLAAIRSRAERITTSRGVSGGWKRSEAEVVSEVKALVGYPVSGGSLKGGAAGAGLFLWLMYEIRQP
jgi:hypothetical protein